MPRIPDDLLNTVFYLYPTEEAAKEGYHLGGTGFYVTAPIDDPRPGHDPTWHSVYAVTNKHVVNKGALYIRANTRDGKVSITKTKDTDWDCGPNKADFAVLRGRLALETHEFHEVPLGEFCSREIIRGWDIGPGDDAFFVGRFINHDGRQRNTPSVRFGNISMMPGEAPADRIKIQNIPAQESYLVEARSIPGYSGSPVFVYNISGRTSDDPVPHIFTQGRTLRNLQALPGTTYLLGIDWCHMHDRHRVEREAKPGEYYETNEKENLWARQNTMMMGVIPAYLIGDYLMSPKVKEMRNKNADRVYSRHSTAGGSADAAPVPRSRPAPGVTGDEFTNALKKASRKLPPSGSARGKKGT